MPLQALYNIMALLLKPSGGEITVALQVLWHVLWGCIRNAPIRKWDESRAQFGTAQLKVQALRRLEPLEGYLMS